jgi:isopenicillin-N epimerase
MIPLKQLFSLDPDVVFLNHGSYGATPREVFDVYQMWQRRLEREPVHFINEELPRHFAEAREALGRYLACSGEDVVYVPNATFGINAVARSLRLAPGDEILSTDHEYGAIENCWSYVCMKAGASYVRRSVPIPASSEEIAETLWSGVTSHTKVLFMSHITSSTALRLPVEALCARARQAGIITIIDGAHAPGQIPLDLRALDPDFYIGNCHKWLCSPKGAAFLYTRRDRQGLIEPLVVGWGWGPNRKPSGLSGYQDAFQWLGTNDYSAYLSVPAAIDFQARHAWPEVGERCHQLLSIALDRISELTGRPSLYESRDQYRQMAVAELPHVADPALFNRRLFDRYRIEIPCLPWNGRPLLRLSIQAYNSEEDIEKLLSALQAELE